MSVLHVSYILIKLIETLIIFSTDLGITICQQTLTERDAVLSDGTF